MIMMAVISAMGFNVGGDLHATLLIYLLRSLSSTDEDLFA
jgi:hypothetical protein